MNDIGLLDKFFKPVNTYILGPILRKESQDGPTLKLIGVQTDFHIKKLAQESMFHPLCLCKFRDFSLDMENKPIVGIS